MVHRAEYTAKFEDCMNYFRAVLRSEEMSPRVHALTSDGAPCPSDASLLG